MDLPYSNAGIHYVKCDYRNNAFVLCLAPASYRPGISLTLSSHNYDNGNYAPCYGLSICSARIATDDGYVFRYEWLSNTTALKSSGSLIQTFSWDNYGSTHDDMM